MKATDVVVVSGGDPLSSEVVEHIPIGALIIAADSGVERALAVGLVPSVAIGDFDSADPTALESVARAGGQLIAHPAAKDQTDLELALDFASTYGPDRITVLGGHGGRLDHFLGNVQLLASPAYAAHEIVAFMGPARVVVVRRAAKLEGRLGDLVTILAVNEVARGVRTRGLLYPLVGEELAPGTTRGVSNELAETSAEVSVESGTLLVIQPGEEIR
jgi:thiamine pyrophosphokinase